MNLNTVPSELPRRRSAPRFPVLAPIAMHLPDGSVVRGEMVNLSLTGMCALVETPVAELTGLRIRTALPVQMPDTGEIESPEIELPALVVRSEGTDRRTVLGLLFGELPIEAEWVIGAHILERFEGLEPSDLHRPER